MAHYALLDENNIVTQVIYVDNQFITDENGNEDDDLAVSKCREGLNDPNARLVKTSYNGNIRGNYAGINYSYSEEYDAFIPPKPHDSWVLNTNTFVWDSPTPRPTEILENGMYMWNEETLNWDVLDFSQNIITATFFRDQLTLSEKLFWDNPDTAETLTQKAVITTFKQELPLTIGEQETTDLLDLLVSEGIYTQERLDEIIGIL